MSDDRLPVRIFISYSHRDDAYKQRLERVLITLKRQGLVEPWSDGKLLPGDQWQDHIERELERADLVLFLVSDDLIASEFIHSREMTRALEREAAGEARIVPIVIRPCDWHPTRLGSFQALPKDGLAVTHSVWGSEDEAWADVAVRLRKLVERLAEAPPSADTKPSSRARHGTPASTPPKPGSTQDDEPGPTPSTVSPEEPRAPSDRGVSKGGPAPPPIPDLDPTRYLEALEHAHSYVEIRGMGAQVAEQLPLDRVYTRLRVTGPGSREAGDEPEKPRPGARLAGEPDEQRPGADAGLHADRDLGLPDVLRRTRHAVLVGDPGSGKTTFLRFAAQVLARAHLRGAPALAARELGLEAATAAELPFPIFVRLSRFAEFLRDHPDGSCPDDAPEHLLRYLDFDSRGRNHGLPESELRRRACAGGCFLLLDGLDEVPGALRPRVAAIVDHLVAADPGNRHLITCRTRAYRGLARLGGLPAFPLAPFEADQVAAFVRGWSRALHLVRLRREPAGDGASDPAREAAERQALARADAYEAELLAAIRSHENVGPMTESPLMLTMLAVVHWNQKKLPERRNELYDQAVEYLLESRRELSPYPPPQRGEALRALALEMFTDPEGVQRSFGLEEAARAVAPLLQVGDDDARAFLDQESLQSGLLVSRTDGEVEFWHLSFQEYLAALELAAGGDWWDVLREGDRLHDDRWNEVVLLLAGCLRRRDGLRAARRFLERILATGTDRLGRARAVGLAGRVLADVLPYGGDPSVGTDFRTMLTETLSIFQPPAPGEEVVEEAVRLEVGEALGQAGDPRLARPEENRVAIPGGTFWMGAQSEDPEAPGYDAEAIDREGPVHRVTVSPFALGRYPVTVQEFRRFVEAGEGGYGNPKLWNPQGWAWREKEGITTPGSWTDQLRHPNRPVVEVSWYEADAYCRWAGGRLPTEAEWEFAARGEEGRRFPWGEEEPDEARASFGWKRNETAPVGSYPLGSSPEGLSDLAGNVLEWCSDRFGPYPEGSRTDPGGAEEGTSRVLRGGSFGYDPRTLRAAYRDDYPPEYRYDLVGFRVLSSVAGGLEP